MEKTVSEIHAMSLVEEICIHLKVQSKVNHRVVLIKYNVSEKFK